jgi:AbrB family looped-hinge helix DNA binding protein
MNAVTVSPKYQVVIPQAVREAMKIRPGQKMQVIQYGDHIMLIPVRPIREARGSLKGLDLDVGREKEDRAI